MKEVTAETVRAAIVLMRENRGMSNTRFANLIETSQSALSQWTTGQKIPTLLSLTNIAALDGICLSGFFERIESGQCEPNTRTMIDILPHFKTVVRDLANAKGAPVPANVRTESEPKLIKLMTAIEIARDLGMTMSQLIRCVEKVATPEPAVFDDSTTLTFTVPGPPVPKERARRAPNGRWYTPTKTRDYERLVASCALHAGAKPKKGPVHITLAIFWPDLRPRDADNVLKSIQDGLNGIGYNDDKQVIGFVVTTDLDRQSPRAVVSVRYMQ